MSFWKKLLSPSKKKETQIMQEPENDLALRPTDDLMVLEKKDESNNLNNKKEDLDIRDSP
jgi:hypothetical protein